MWVNINKYGRQTRKAGRQDELMDIFTTGLLDDMRHWMNFEGNFTIIDNEVQLSAKLTGQCCIFKARAPLSYI